MKKKRIDKERTFFLLFLNFSYNEEEKIKEGEFLGRKTRYKRKFWKELENTGYLFELKWGFIEFRRQLIVEVVICQGLFIQLYNNHDSRP